MHNTEDTYLDPSASINGTHRVGELMASARYLIDALGEPPHGESGDGKVTMEWHFQTPAGIATVYDYKWGAASDLDASEQWSIGGHDARVVPYVKEYIRARRAEIKRAPKENMRVTLTVKVNYDAASLKDTDRMQLSMDLRQQLERAIGDGLLTPNGEEIVNNFSIEIGG